MAYDGSIRIDTKINTAEAEQGLKSLSDSVSKQSKAMGDALGHAAKALEVIPKAFPQMQSMAPALEQVSGGLQLVSSGFGVVSSAATMLTNPMGAVIFAVGTLAAGITILCGAMERQKSEAEILIENVHASKEAYDSMNQSAQERVAGDLAQIQHVKNLSDELRVLANANGYVEETNRSRAEFILGEMNGALGTEYEMVDGVIVKYGQLTDSIDNLILKKQAQILLEANEEKYQTAIQNKTEAVKAQEAAYKELVEAQNNYIEKEKEYVATGCGDSFLNAQAARVEELGKKYNETGETVRQYSADVTEHQAAMTASIEGDFGRVITLLDEGNNAYKTSAQVAAETANMTKEAIGENYAQAVRSVEVAYDNLQQLDNEANRSALANAVEYAGNMRTAYENAGGEIVEGQVTGMDGKKITLVNKSKEISTAAADALRTTRPEYASSAGYAGDGIVEGLASKGDAVYAAGYALGQKGLQGYNDAQAAASPAKEYIRAAGYAVAGLVVGLKAGERTLYNQMSDTSSGMIDAAKDTLAIHSPSRIMRDEVGAMIVDGMALGITDNEYKVSDAFKNLLLDLDLWRKMGVLSEAQYYEKLKYYRDEHITAGTKEWWDYTQKILEYQGRAFAQTVKEAEEADKRLEKQMQVYGKVTLEQEIAIYRDRAERYRQYAKQVLERTDITQAQKLELEAEYAKMAEDLDMQVFEKEQRRKKEQFDKELADLDKAHQRELISDEMYFAARESLRDQYFDRESQEYQEQSKRILDLQDEHHYKMAKEQEDALKKQQDKVKALGLSGSALFGETSSMYEGAGRGWVLNEKTGKYEWETDLVIQGVQLADVKVQTRELEEYLALLEKTEGMSLPQSLMDTIEGMSVADGTKFMQALLKLDSQKLKKYITDWIENEQVRDQVAKRLEPIEAEVAAQGEEVAKAFGEGLREELGKTFENVPQGFYDCGEQAAQGFENGIISVLSGLAERIRLAVSNVGISVMGTFAPVTAGGSTVNYHFAASGETVAQQIQAARSAQDLQMARGM